MQRLLYLMFLCLTTNCLFLNKNSRVIAFLTGAPDYEDGQLDTKRYGEQYASKGEDVDLMLLPEQIPSYRDLVSLCFFCSKKNFYPLVKF